MTEKWMSDFQRYAFTFDSLFRRFQSTAVIFNEILSAKRKMVSFSDGLNEYERNESKKETNILVSLLATVSVAVMSYDSHTVVRNPLDYACFFFFFLSCALFHYYIAFALRHSTITKYWPLWKIYVCVYRSKHAAYTLFWTLFVCMRNANFISDPQRTHGLTEILMIRTEKKRTEQISHISITYAI